MVFSTHSNAWGTCRGPGCSATWFSLQGQGCLFHVMYISSYTDRRLSQKATYLLTYSLNSLWGTIFLHLRMSWAASCASSHKRPISNSSDSTILRQVIIVWPLSFFLLESILWCSGGIQSRCPSHFRRQCLISVIVFWQPVLLQSSFLIFYWATVKLTDFVHVTFGDPPALGTIK